jgi:hypothetical protein
MDAAGLIFWLTGRLRTWADRGFGSISIQDEQRERFFKQAERLYLTERFERPDFPPQTPDRVRDQYARYKVVLFVLETYLNRYAPRSIKRLVARVRTRAAELEESCDDYSLALGLIVYLYSTENGWPVPSVARVVSDLSLPCDERTARIATTVALVKQQLDLRARSIQSYRVIERAAGGLA